MSDFDHVLARAIIADLKHLQKDDKFLAVGIAMSLFMNAILLILFMVKQ